MSHPPPAPNYQYSGIQFYPGQYAPPGYSYPHSYAQQPQQPRPAAEPASQSQQQGGQGGRRAKNAASLKGIFVKDLKSLMYGFGDKPTVASDSVAVMEEILIEYIVNVCLAASAPSKKQRLQIEDIRRVLSRPADGKKLARMEELLFMQEDIKRARREFDDNPVPSA